MLTDRAFLALLQPLLNTLMVVNMVAFQLNALFTGLKLTVTDGTELILLPFFFGFVFESFEFLHFLFA